MPCNFCCEIKCFYIVTLMSVHRSLIFTTAIDFGLILRGITQFKLIGDGRAWKVDGGAQALVGPGLPTPLVLWLLTNSPITWAAHSLLLIISISTTLGNIKSVAYTPCYSSKVLINTCDFWCLKIHPLNDWFKSTVLGCISWLLALKKILRLARNFNYRFTHH